MPTSRASTRYAWSLVVLVAVTAVVVGVGVVMNRGVGPVPLRQRCTADVGGRQVELDLEQARYASLIAAIGVRRGLPARAVSIALATAYQESKLHNLDRGDRDSLGLFQQRPSQGWGTVAQVRDPYHATNRFYDALVKVEGFESMRITEAAQRVQRSGYPEAYEPHAADARALASALTGYSSGGRFTCVLRDRGRAGSPSRASADLRRAFGPLSGARAGRGGLAVSVPRSMDGRRRGWAVAQYLLAHAPDLGVRTVAYDGRRWTVGSRRGWVADARATRRTVVAGLG